MTAVARGLDAALARAVLGGRVVNAEIKPPVQGAKEWPWLLTAQPTILWTATVN